VDILTVASILGIVLAAFFAVRQMRLAAQQVNLAATGLLEERKEREAREKQRRVALVTALRAEVETIHYMVDGDLNDYEGYNLSHPRIARQGAARDVEGRERYRVSFPWTPLPDTAIQEAIRGADLLGLTVAQTQRLLQLQARVQRINSLVLHKANLLPALLLVPVPRNEPLIYGDRPWPFDKAMVLNNDIQMAAKDILADCAEMMKWWEGEAGVTQSRTSSRPVRRATRGRFEAGRWPIVAAARERISSRLSWLILQGVAK